jgi:7-cyano-7-deazaguanine synthase
VSKYAIAIFSGGLDSTTLVYHLLSEGYDVDCLSFDYGQRHKKELTYAVTTCMQLNLKHDIVDLSALTHLISNSALTSPARPGVEDFKARNSTGATYPEREVEVPDGHYAEDNMKLTVVPNRNMIMISIAAGVAVNRQATTVAAGMHAGDHFIYPDCRPEFIFSCGQAILRGTQGFHNFASGSIDDVPVEDAQGRQLRDYAKQMGYHTVATPITTPFLDMSKADIAYRALQLNVPLHMTWSCYKGGDKHCGRCGTCVERLEAVDEAINRLSPDTKVKYEGTRLDVTEYEDTEYWRRAVQVVKERESAEK